MESIISIIDRFNPIFYILRCALNNTKPDKSALEGVNFDELRTLCRFHGVNAMAATALLSVDGIEDIIGADGKKQCHYSKSRSIGRYLTYKDETQLVCEALAKREIHYTKLKGIVLGDYYAQIGMREMSDVDLLIDSDKIKQAGEVMRSFGYEGTALELSNHDVFQKPPMLCFEIHDELFTKYHRKYYDYYINCRDKMIPATDDPYELRFTDEDFYIYMLAHSVKHLYDSGVGLRALTDIYVFLNSFELDRGYVDCELEALGILKEEQVMRSLAFKLLSPSQSAELPSLTDSEEKVLTVILESGANGTLEQSIKNRTTESVFSDSGEISAKSKRAYIKSRLFPKPEAYEIAHPFFYRHKAARPFLVFVRIGEALFKKKDGLKTEIKMLSKVQTDKSKTDK